MICTLFASRGAQHFEVAAASAVRHRSYRDASLDQRSLARRLANALAEPFAFS